jgi:hypothetical protein
MCRTAPLTSRRCILNIYSTNIRTVCFKRPTQSAFFYSKCRSFHNAIVFGYCIIHILNTGCAYKLTENSDAKFLNMMALKVLGILTLSVPN